MNNTKLYTPGSIICREGEPGDCMYEVESGKVGFDRNGSLAPRLELTQEESDILEEATAARTTRLSEIAKETGSTLSAVRKSHGEKMLARMPAGTWFQDESGAWAQKK